MKKYILAIDQGTTSSRAILFDKESNIVASASRPVELIYPHEGWVEANAKDIWISVINVISEVLINADITWEEIDSIAITDQRETSIVWDRKTGKAVYNAIVWQSRQSSAICESLSAKSSIIQNKTGLIINPYFSASKIRFILDSIDNGQKRAEAGELMFGTIDTWLIYNLTRGEKHLTDVTNASRTCLFNIKTLEWDKELCSIFNIPMNMLPEVKENSCDYGAASFFHSDVHICGVAGDQQASLFGHNCFNEGDCKNTYGTGCFMLMNIGNTPIISSGGLLTTVGWKINGKPTYALEGSVYIGGAAIEWLKNSMKLIEKPSEVDERAVEVSSSDGVYVVPAFVGLGTPYWDDNVRGSIFGMTRATNKSHIIRATVEGIAYQSKDVFDVMVRDTCVNIRSLQVDGGATKCDTLMQFQSDICNIEIKKPCCIESTALGAAYFAGLYTGFWSSLQEIKKYHSYQKVFTPIMDAEEREKRCKGWKNAVKAAQTFKLGE